jgi:hypothetical protein
MNLRVKYPDKQKNDATSVLADILGYCMYLSIQGQELQNKMHSSQ